MHPQDLLHSPLWGAQLGYAHTRLTQVTQSARGGVPTRALRAGTIDSIVAAQVAAQIPRKLTGVGWEVRHAFMPLRRVHTTNNIYRSICSSDDSCCRHGGEADHVFVSEVELGTRIWPKSGDRKRVHTTAQDFTCRAVHTEIVSSILGTPQSHLHPLRRGEWCRKYCCQARCFHMINTCFCCFGYIDLSLDTLLFVGSHLHFHDEFKELLVVIICSKLLFSRGNGVTLVGWSSLASKHPCWPLPMSSTRDVPVCSR